MQVTMFFLHAKELRDALPPNERPGFAKTYLEMVALAKQLGVDYKKLEGR